jgi:hypothetical protein
MTTMYGEHESGLGMRVGTSIVPLRSHVYVRTSIRLAFLINRIRCYWYLLGWPYDLLASSHMRLLPACGTVQLMPLGNYNAL